MPSPPNPNYDGSISEVTWLAPNWLIMLRFDLHQVFNSTALTHCMEQSYRRLHLAVSLLEGASSLQSFRHRQPSASPFRLAGMLNHDIDVDVIKSWEIFQASRRGRI